MQRKKKGNLEWLEFDLLADKPGIAHGVLLRHGGVSTGPFASLNVIYGVGDDDHNVAGNRLAIKEAFQVDTLISGYQVHGTHIEIIATGNESGLQCDGLMTNRMQCGLLALHADCQAAIIYDPKRKALATIHAGWRGQAQQIYQKAISKMSGTFGSLPQDMLVCISPSLGPQNAQFINYRTELPEDFWQFQTVPEYFDLWAIAEYQLTSCGILPHHIEIAAIDTYAEPTDFYSYRREKKSGRTEKITGCHGTVAVLR